MYFYSRCQAHGKFATGLGEVEDLVVLWRVVTSIQCRMRDIVGARHRRCALGLLCWILALGISALEKRTGSIGWSRASWKIK